MRQGRRALLAGLAALALPGAARGAAPLAVAAITADGALDLGPGGEIVAAGIALPADAALRARALGLLQAKAVAAEPLLTDRHGRAVVRLADGTALGLQGRLVAAGLAYVDPTLVAFETAALLAREAAARDARLGLWAVPRLAVQDAQTVRARPARFAVVHGRPLRASERAGFLFLDFGADWRTDFTLRAELPLARRLRRDGLDLAALVGRPLRARGWLFALAGAMIELTRGEQIEVL
jgi:micrococcal nuclease